jgi:hypothetical protein
MQGPGLHLQFGKLNKGEIGKKNIFGLVITAKKKERGHEVGTSDSCLSS